MLLQVLAGRDYQRERFGIHLENYNVVPLEGIGPVRLGMSRAQARVAMNLQSQIRTDHAHSPGIDFYHDNAFQVFFDAENRVEYIELAPESSFVAFYKGVRVHETLDPELLGVIEKDAEFDEDDSEIGYSYISPSLELSVWRPMLPDEGENGCFATIGIGKRGYYSAAADEN